MVFVNLIYDMVVHDFAAAVFLSKEEIKQRRVFLLFFFVSASWGFLESWFL